MSDHLSVEPSCFAMSKEIRRAPPASQEEVGERYVGVNVEWPLFYWMALKNTDGTYDLVFHIERNFQHIEVDCGCLNLNEHPRFKSLYQESLVLVRGIIGRASGHKFVLKNVTLQLLKEASAPGDPALPTPAADPLVPTHVPPSQTWWNRISPQERQGIIAACVALFIFGVGTWLNNQRSRSTDSSPPTTPASSPGVIFRQAATLPSRPSFTATPTSPHTTVYQPTYSGEQGAALMRAESDLNRVYFALKQRLTPSEFQALQTSQLKWINLRDTMRDTPSATQLTIERTQALQRQLSNLPTLANPN